MQKCLEIHTSRDTRIPTGVLNRLLSPSIERRPPGSKGKRFAKVYYAAQTGSKPPAFTLFVNDPRFFGDNYRRYLEKRIRQIYPFEGCPLRIRVRKSK
jgi:GTP-binding protein